MKFEENGQTLKLIKQLVNNCIESLTRLNDKKMLKRETLEINTFRLIDEISSVNHSLNDEIMKNKDMIMELKELLNEQDNRGTEEKLEKALIALEACTDKFTDCINEPASLVLHHVSII